MVANIKPAVESVPVYRRVKTATSSCTTARTARIVKAIGARCGRRCRRKRRSAGDRLSRDARVRLERLPGRDREPERELRNRLGIDSAAEGFTNSFVATTKLMKVMAWACGHDDLGGFERRDLTTWKRDVADLTGVSHFRL